MKGIVPRGARPSLPPGRAPQSCAPAELAGKVIGAPAARPAHRRQLLAPVHGIFAAQEIIAEIRAPAPGTDRHIA